MEAAVAPISLDDLDGGSAGWAGPPSLPAGCGHRVQFYDSEAFLEGVVSDFLAQGIAAGQSLVVIATAAHGAGFCAALDRKGFDSAGARRAGQLTVLDAHQTLAMLMVGDMPDERRFRAVIGPVLQVSAARSDHAPVRAYGEMVDILAQEGNEAAAIRLEELWNELGRNHPFILLCAYSMGRFGSEDERKPFERICRLHTHVAPAEDFVGDGDPERLRRQVTLLQQRSRALESELAHRRKLEGALRAQQQELVDFFENAAEGLHWVAADGTIVWANRAELTLLGYERAEYVGRNIAEFHVDQQAIGDILARLLRRETLRDHEAQMRCKDGSVKTVLISSNALFRDGEFVHTRCFTRDITDKRRLDEELRRQNDDLARTVRFSDMFAGILGHDLRNPLSSVVTAASLLLRRYSDEGVTRPAGRIVTSAHRMARMIDQLLDFTRIRLGQGLPVRRQRIDLAQICRTVGDEVDTAPGRARIEVRGDVVGFWDGDRLGQLLSNLIGNALTHGTAGSPVLIRVHGDSADEVALEIANDGALAEDLLPVIFEPLRSRVDSKNAGSSGLGLGLYISHQIVLAHSGTISVTSSAQDGTRFTIRLPRQSPDGNKAFEALGDRGS
jgi:PAS domain S-box-containing protein